jgi:hypothetical protein
MEGTTSDACSMDFEQEKFSNKKNPMAREKRGRVILHNSSL